MRIFAGLTGASGKVAMRGGGTLDLYTAYLEPRKEDTRSASEAIFQSSVMDEVTGSYDAQKDVNTFLFWSYPGNSTRGAEKTAERLFGRTYDVHGQQDFQIVLDARSLMDRDEARAFLDRAKPELSSPTIVDAVLDDMGTSHSLVLEKIEDDRVFFRNPWGPQSPATNSGRVEDASRALYSMTKIELSGRMQAYLSPR